MMTFKIYSKEDVLVWLEEIKEYIDFKPSHEELETIYELFNKGESHTYANVIMVDDNTYECRFTTKLHKDHPFTVDTRPYVIGETYPIDTIQL